MYINCLVTDDHQCVDRAFSAGVVSGLVNHVLVPVISSRLCNILYDKIPHAITLDITDDMMCAGLEQGGKDACQVAHSRKCSETVADRYWFYGSSINVIAF